MWFDEYSIDWLIAYACKIIFIVFLTLRSTIFIQCAKLFHIHHCLPADRRWYILVFRHWCCWSQLGAKTTTTTLNLLPRHPHNPILFASSLTRPCNCQFMAHLMTTWTETETPPRSGLSKAGSMPDQCQIKPKINNLYHCIKCGESYEGVLLTLLVGWVGWGNRKFLISLRACGWIWICSCFACCYTPWATFLFVWKVLYK